MTCLQYCHIQGKVRYPTYWAAMRTLRIMNAKSFHTGGSVYRCPHCHSWHLTHYDHPLEQINDGFIARPMRQSKKQRRSTRRKWRQACRPGKPAYLPPAISTEDIHGHLADQLNTDILMYKIIPMLPNASAREMAAQYSEAFGNLKLICGFTVNCALYQLHEAMVMLQQLPTYRQEAKRLLRATDAEVERYERELLRPSEGIRLFSIAEFDEVYRRRYADITDRQYFEFWQSTGYEMYARCLPHIRSLAWKLQRYVSPHVPAQSAPAFANAMCAYTLLDMAVSSHECLTRHWQAQLPPVSPTFTQMSAPLSPVRILRSLERALDVMFMDRMPDLTPGQKHDISLTEKDISGMWCDPELHVQIQQAIIEDWADEIFSSRREVKRTLASTCRWMNEVRQLKMQQRLEELQQQKGGAA